MAATLDFSVVIDAAPRLVQGAVLTLEIAGLASLGAIAVGIVGASMRTSKNSLARGVATAFTEFFRNTPPLVQQYFLYFGLPAMPLLHPRLSSFMCIVLALTIYQGAIAIEILRSGLEAVHPGQREAAAALGLGKLDQQIFVIIPQAFRISLPAMGNNVIALLKNSSIAYAIGVPEITGTAQDLIAIVFRSAELFITIGVFYLVVSWIISGTLKIIERRLAVYA